MRGKEWAADKDQLSEGKAKEEEASTAPLPEKVRQGAAPCSGTLQRILCLPSAT